MNFLSSLAKSAGGQSADEPKKTAGEEASTTDLFSSAKVLAEAAQSQFNKDSGKIDNKKVAAAAADVLDAAQKYGKLDETQGVGQYVEKAETYLHEYGSANPSTTTDAAAAKAPAAAPDTEETKAPAPAPAAADTEETKAPAPAPAAADTEETKPPAPAAVDTEETKPPAPADTEEPPAPAPVPAPAPEEKGEGYGQYVKMAEGFLKPGDGESAKASEGGSDYLKMAGDFLGKK
ncbi:nodulin-related protein 2 [Nicotiana sylvestris]|uniref:Skin secretory protein xP2-like n=2 Tax=Nicotiana TaxID=4085 RepID=A0A1S4D2Y6_TOBAC|nr:PREDICTED: skin secretory protein xP2 [Nicotiana sylvestris]XP_016507746.1 PREDICTED: skin secretory protein xP2-like [Nicotiana tabacum]